VSLGATPASRGEGLIPNGIYFFRLQAGTYMATKRILVVNDSMMVMERIQHAERV
jgi:hypothetical protein